MTKPMRIVFFSEGIPFTGDTVFNRCLGGMESSLIYMAQALADRGHDVSVFNSCVKQYVCGKVTYYPIDFLTRWEHIQNIDVAVSCRTFAPLRVAFNPKLLVYWTGDAWNQPFVEPLKNPDIRDRFDFFALKSQWQTQTFVSHLGICPEKCMVTRNGFYAPYYREIPPGRNRFRLIYTSTPYRGLDVLLDMFPNIKETVPQAELHLFSSMKVYNYTDDDDKKLFGHIYDKSNQPGVYLHESIPQPELAKELMRSAVMVYPNHFEETSCVAAIEAQAAGVPVVTSALAALRETVEHGKSGFLIPSDSRLPEYKELFIEKVLALLRDEHLLDEMSRYARERAFSLYTWEKISAEWEQFFAEKIVYPCQRYINWFVKTGDYKKLLAITEETIQQGHGSRDMMLLAGSLYVKLNKLDKAELIFKELLRNEPQNVEALCRLGETRRLRGEEFEAIQCFRQALDIAPSYEHAWFQLAGIYEAKGYLRKALATYRQCFDLNTEYSGFAGQKIRQITEAMQAKP